ncbi:DAK2 domain-containing protein [Tsukamurella sp. PLM1]|uniref:DAK2 domain-containing protein n=1 Tax=Tsukamurella sp. PLM1 TaxID=2929795 RepID=UPI0020BD6FCE|nr:DAK2 domain-containing protein [Tsukamurella sp. PLM1]
MTGPNPEDGRVVVAWLRRAVLGLERAVDEINALNVFPVADADTGTNMLVTLRAAARAAEEADRREGPHAVARATVAGAVAGARGNSGVIVSQIMRGVAAQLGEDADLTAAGLAEGLRSATELVTAAVAAPVEGTILSVLRGASDGAGAALAAGGDLGACARRRGHGLRRVVAHPGAVVGQRRRRRGRRRGPRPARAARRARRGHRGRGGRAPALHPAERPARARARRARRHRRACARPRGSAPRPARRLRGDVSAARRHGGCGHPAA